MRCSQCGAENPSGFKFCGNCGTPLTNPVTIKPKVKTSQLHVFGTPIPPLIVIVLSSFCLVSILCLSKILPVLIETHQLPTGIAVLPSPSTISIGITVLPTSANSNALTFEEIRKTAIQLTEFKRNDYYKSLVSKNIHDSGIVADVSQNGDIHVRITSTLSYDIVLQEVPKTLATSLNLKDHIEFDGTIINISDLFGSGNPILTVKSTHLNKLGDGDYKIEQYCTRKLITV